MNAKSFVDTNIWVYAHLNKAEDAKWEKANRLVETLDNLVISTQVMSEYYAVMLKNRVEDGWIQDNLEEMAKYCELVPIDLTGIRAAHRIRLRYRFSYWDSLIIASALQARCSVLYSEDMQAGQEIEDYLRIE